VTSHATFAPLPNWLLRRTEITSTAKLVYARLNQYRGRNGHAWPSYSRLAAEVGISRRQCIAVMGELNRAKLVTVTHRQGSNLYALPSHPWVAAGEKTSPPAGEKVSPTGEESSPHAGEAGFTRRDQGEDRIEKELPRRRKRELWQIQKDLETVKAQRSKVWSRMQDAARQRGGCLTSDEISNGAKRFCDPKDMATYNQLHAKCRQLEKELEDAAT
jgi:hypothetical protein